MRKKKTFFKCLLSVLMIGTLFAGMLIIDTSTASAAAALKIKSAKKTFFVGETVTLSANKKVKWTITSGKKVIKITSKKAKSIKIKGLKAGTAYVQAKAGKKIKKVKLVVKNSKTPTSIKIAATRTKIGKGEYCIVSVKSVAPATASKEVTFVSSDKDVATVTNQGLIAGISPGTATITAKSVYNSKITASVVITVSEVKNGTVTVSVDLTDPERYPAGKVARVWLAVPESDSNQNITHLHYKAPKATDARYTYDSAGNKELYLEWDASAAPEDRTASLSFHVYRKAVVFDKNLPSYESDGLSPEELTEVSKYLQETLFSGSFTEGIVKETADKIVADANAQTVYDKAHAIYTWVTNNCSRDLSSQNIMNGDVVKILSSDGSGVSCTDNNAVFVSLCRAVGIPARETYGMRLKQHSSKCKAQFYLPGYGWVEVDPSQPLKVIMGNEAAFRDPDGEFADQWQAIQDSYWATADEDWMLFSIGNDLVLDPPQDGVSDVPDYLVNPDGTLVFFAFPYGEFDGKYISSTQSDIYKYTLEFEEDEDICGC